MSEFFPFFVSFCVSFLLTIPTIFFAKKLKLVTDTTKRFHPAHTHNGIIPRAGGLPIYIALVFTVLIFVPMTKLIMGIIIANGLLIIVGLIDDYIDSSPYKRFFANIFISCIVVACGLGIPYVSNPFSMNEAIRLDKYAFSFAFLGEHTILFLADTLAVFWLVSMMNMINWSKGVDGQLPGFVGITAIFLGLLTHQFVVAHDVSVSSVATISFIVAGAYLGFLPFNFYPQKIMPGYGGGAMAGFILGILSILSYGKIGTAILILSVPIIDAIYTIIRRLMNKQSPFRADWGHFHHRLLEIGWGKRRIAIFYWLISCILGIIGLYLKGYQKLLMIGAMGCIIIIFMILIQIIKKNKKTDTNI